MKKWFDKMDKNKKRIMGAGIVITIMLLLALGAWGVYTVMEEPQNNVAKGDTIDGKDSGKETAAKKHEKGSSAQENVEDLSVKDEKKEEEENGSEGNVSESDEKEKTDQVNTSDDAKATQQGDRNSTSIASSNSTKNVTPQGNTNANQNNQTTTPAQAQGATSSQSSQQQNQTPVAPAQNTTPTTEPKPETKPTSQPKEEKQPVWHDPVYERRWVVDQAAWDEIVETPVYTERAICNQCGVDITANVEEHMLDYMHGWHSETRQTGTNTSTIHHDEVGHWEEVMVKDGYWE